MSIVVSGIAALFGALRRRDQSGQGLAEYALILALVAIVVIVSLIFLGENVADTLSKVGDSLGNPGGTEVVDPCREFLCPVKDVT